MALDALSESEKMLTLGGINYYIISRRIKIEESSNFYEFLLNTEIENEVFLSSNVDAIVLLYESIDDIALNEKLETAIINIHKFDCNYHLHFRDMRYFLDFNEFDSPKLESLIINKKVR